MSPILTGVIASGISGNLTPPWSPEGGYDALATAIVPAGGASTITFSGIPQTYKHLQIRYVAQGSSPDIAVQYNGDTGLNYSRHYFYGTGSSALAGGNPRSSNNWVEYGYIPTATGNIFGVGVTDLLDYRNPNKFKVNKTICGYDNNSAGYIIMYSGAWYSTDPITSMTISDFSGTFVENSQFSLYGVK